MANLLIGVAVIAAIYLAAKHIVKTSAEGGCVGCSACKSGCSSCPSKRK